MRKLQMIILFIVMFMSVIPSCVLAAPAELSATAMSTLEKLISGANTKEASNLRTQLSKLLTVQGQEQQRDVDIKEIHYQNEQNSIHVRKQIKLIDANKLSKLDQQVKTTKARYQPLFNSYTALNRQIDVARILKNKKLNSTLRSQADVMKIAVQLARQDVRSKEDLLKKAKSDNAKTIKAHRASLSNIDPIKVNIKLERSRMAKTKQRFSSEWRTLNAAIKKSNAESIISSLTSLTTIGQQMNEHMMKIYNYEKSIQDIVLHVQSQIS